MSESTPDPTPAQADAMQRVHDHLQFEHRFADELAGAHPVVRGDRLEQPGLRHDRIMAAEPGQRFQVISDVLDETYGPGAGPGNLTHGGFDAPSSVAAKFHALGFSDEQITTALQNRIDENGHIDTTQVTAALADLAQAPGGDLDYQKTPAAVAYRASVGITDTFDQKYDLGEAEYMRDLEHEEAIAVDQFANEHPGADLSALDVGDGHEVALTRDGGEPATSASSRQHISWTTTRLQPDGTWAVTEQVDRLATDQEQARIDAADDYDTLADEDVDTDDEDADGYPG